MNDTEDNVSLKDDHSLPDSSSFRFLHDDDKATCPPCPACGDDDNDHVIHVKLLSVGGEGVYIDFIAERFASRTAAFANRTASSSSSSTTNNNGKNSKKNRRVEVQVVRVGQLNKLQEEIQLDMHARVYDGYVFLPLLTGSLVQQNGLADLTEFVRTNADLDWPDLLSFTRQEQAVYDNVVRLVPCDGDVHSLYYRQDLFDFYNIAVPRTWDEYTAVAKFFHGKKVPKRTINNNNNNSTLLEQEEEMVTLTGSCVGRKPTCSDFGYFNILVHSTSTQARGTTSGALFDPTTFEPLMGEAMAETLRHLENQILYGAGEQELTNDSCSGFNVERLNAGTCAMTYMWGDAFARHLLEGSVFLNDGVKLGIAPTPGVTKVLDRSNLGKGNNDQPLPLVSCNPERCPHGETYADIGRVNRAPYAAAGGWSAAVSAHVSPERQAAMADFLGYVCGREQSILDVIPNASGPVFTGADPYRKSHLDENDWQRQGNYPSETTRLYLETVEAQLSYPKTVLDVRFPEATKFVDAMNARIFLHLNESLTTTKTQQDRMLVANEISDEWKQIARDYNNREDTNVPLETIYQKSLNIYFPETTGRNNVYVGPHLAKEAVVGIVVGWCVFVGIVAGIVACSFMKRERDKSQMQWRIKPEEIQISHHQVLGEGSFGSIVKGCIQGTPVAVKTSHNTLMQQQQYAAQNESATSDPEKAATTTASTTSKTNFKGKLGAGLHYPHFMDRQLKEDLSVLVKLRHPHVVQTLGAVIDKKCLYIVFEFMEHASLSSVLADPAGVAKCSKNSGGTSSGSRAFDLQWVLQVARGLQFLHCLPQPLLHEELKSSNIMIDASYNAKVANFALESRVIGSGRDRGSMLWMAPEVLNGEKCSKSSDVYSFAMLIYEIISRARPFKVRRFSESATSSNSGSAASRPLTTMSTVSEDDDGAAGSCGTFSSNVPEKGGVAEYYGVLNGQKITVPELISHISNVLLEPPARPELPADSPLILRDLCVECWNKNPQRRPTIEEVVERLSGASSINATQTLFEKTSLFDSILPQHVQEALLRNEKVPPQPYDNVTVIFSDVVGFTSTSSQLTAEEVGDLIMRLFAKYDALAAKWGVKKLDVIGDAFLGVAGIPEEVKDHAVRAAGFALEAIQQAQVTPICDAKPHLGSVNIRFGLATGPVVATVIGTTQYPKYTLFGTTVNTASRMESTSECNRVQCTQETADLLRNQATPIGVSFRKRMEIKGRGELDTYFVSAPPEECGGLGSILPTSSERNRSSRRSMGHFRASPPPSAISILSTSQVRSLLRGSSDSLSGFVVIEESSEKEDKSDNEVE